MLSNAGWQTPSTIFIKIFVNIHLLSLRLLYKFKAGKPKKRTTEQQGLGSSVSVIAKICAIMCNEFNIMSKYISVGMYT